MSTIVTRYGKGSPLTWLEVDNNFTNLNTDKIQSGDTVSALTITTATINGGTASLSSITNSGNLAFTGTGNRITGDFSNATQSNRVLFQNSITNAGTTIGVIPNGTGTNGQINLFSSSDPANSSVLSILNSSSLAESRFQSGITGTGTYLPITFYTGGYERMRIDTSGNVGIGTSSPAANTRLTLSDTQSVKLKLIGGSNQNGYILDSVSASNQYYIGAGNNLLNTGDKGFMIYDATNAVSKLIFLDNVGETRLSGTTYSTFYTNTLERMRIDSSGNVGIGGTPAYKLDVVSSAFIGSRLSASTSTNGVSQVYSNTGGNLYVGLDSSIGANLGTAYSGFLWHTGAYPIVIANNNTERMRIDASGNVGIGTNNPSAPGGAINFVTNSTGTTIVKSQTTGTGAISARFDWATGTANSYAIAAIQDNAGSPYWLLSGGPAITNAYYDMPIHIWRNSSGAERMRIDSAGLVGIGTSSPSALLTLAAGTATANTSPLKFTSGTNLTTPEAGSIEYDGTIITATTNTSFKRGTIPITNYTSGAGTSLSANAETTLAALLPSANDTITLPIGTYFLDVAFNVTRTGTSTTSATARLNILGGGATTVGSFSGMSLSAPTAGGATANFSFDAVNINVSNVLTTASTTAGGVYTMTLRGLLKITTAGTIIPQYNLSATLGTGGAGGASVKVLYFRLQQVDTQSAAAFGPAGTGWA